MSNAQYYLQMKELARSTREHYGISGFKVGITDVQRIYKSEEITYDLVPNKNCPFYFKNIQGAYMNDGDGVSILINKKLPNDPRVFTMAHELKHHYVDSAEGSIFCVGDENSLREVGANVFAAEFVLPDELFASGMQLIGCSEPCTPEDLVRFKIGTGTSLSYEGLVKKATFLKMGDRSQLAKVKYNNLAKTLYGGYADVRRLRLKQGICHLCNSE